MNFLYAILILIPLTGCIQPRDYSQADIAHCNDLGFKPGTEAFANCRLQLEQMHVSKTAAAAAMIGANNSMRPRTCNTIGAQTTCY